MNIICEKHVKRQILHFSCHISVYAYTVFTTFAAFCKTWNLAVTFAFIKSYTQTVSITFTFSTAIRDFTVTIIWRRRTNMATVTVIASTIFPTRFGGAGAVSITLFLAVAIIFQFCSSTISARSGWTSRFAGALTSISTVVFFTTVIFLCWFGNKNWTLLFCYKKIDIKLIKVKRKKIDVRI